MITNTIQAGIKAAIKPLLVSLSQQQGYHFYFGTEMLPVTPEKLSTKIKNKNKTITLMNEGEVNLLKTAGLTEYKFDILLPNVSYPFAEYLFEFQPAGYYLEFLEKLKTEKEPFQFIVSRVHPGRGSLFKTNTTVTLEEYEIKESAEDGFDCIVSVELKQYRPFETRVVKLTSNKKKAGTTGKKRVTKKAASGTSYTVKPGDCLWKISKSCYGDGGNGNKIYAANKSAIEKAAKKHGKSSSQNGRYIYPGTVLKIP